MSNENKVATSPWWGFFKKSLADLADTDVVEPIKYDWKKIGPDEGFKLKRLRKTVYKAEGDFIDLLKASSDPESRRLSRLEHKKLYMTAWRERQKARDKAEKIFQQTKKELKLRYKRRRYVVS